MSEGDPKPHDERPINPLEGPEAARKRTEYGRGRGSQRLGPSPIGFAIVGGMLFSAGAFAVAVVDGIKTSGLTREIEPSTYMPFWKEFDFSAPVLKVLSLADMVSFTLPFSRAIIENPVQTIGICMVAGGALTFAIVGILEIMDPSPKRS